MNLHSQDTMSQRFTASAFIVLSGLFSGCGSSSPSSNTSPLDDDNTNPSSPEASLIASSVVFAGILPIANELDVDIAQMLEEADYGNPFLESVSNDGSNFLVSVESNTSTSNRAYIRIDTETGIASWVLTDVSTFTGIIFDGSNRAIVAASPACADINFIDVANDAPIIFNDLIPNDRCLGKFVPSKNGNVLIYETWNREPVVNGIANYDHQFFSYNLNTAQGNQYPDTSIVSGGIKLEPAIPLLSGSRSFPAISIDGSQVSSKQWWGLYEPDSGELDKIGSVIWNTQTNEWKTVGLANGDRTWCRNDLNDCAQPFNYFLSANGQVTYSQIPNGAIVDSDKYGYYDGSVISRSEFNASNEVQINTLENVVITSVNNDGQLLAFYASEASGDLTQGLNVYDNTTGNIIPIESAIADCTSERIANGETRCDDAVVNNIRNAYFSDDGSHLFIAASGFPSTLTAELTLNLESGSLYLLPFKLTAFQEKVNADATVFVAPSIESDTIFHIAKHQP